MTVKHFMHAFISNCVYSDCVERTMSRHCLSKCIYPFQSLSTAAASETNINIEWWWASITFPGKWTIYPINATMFLIHSMNTVIWWHDVQIISLRQIPCRRNEHIIETKVMNGDTVKLYKFTCVWGGNDKHNIIHTILFISVFILQRPPSRSCLAYYVLRNLSFIECHREHMQDKLAKLSFTTQYACTSQRVAKPLPLQLWSHHIWPAIVILPF